MNSALPSNPYQALTTYEYDRDQRYNGDMGAYLMGLGNDKLRWQDTYQHNIGVDLTLFNEILSVQGNYYRKETKNYISSLGLSYSAWIPKIYGEYRDSSERGRRVECICKFVQEAEYYVVGEGCDVLEQEYDRDPFG